VYESIRARRGDIGRGTRSTFASPSWTCQRAAATRFSSRRKKRCDRYERRSGIEAHLRGRSTPLRSRNPRDLEAAPGHAVAAGALRGGDVHGPVRADQRALREISYEWPAKQVSRVTTVDGVLEAITRWPAWRRHQRVSGHFFAVIRCRVPPRGAATVFYGIWPAAVVAGAFLVRRRTA